jgi:hypothetical protein
VDPLARKGLEPSRLAGGAVGGVVIGVGSILMLGSEAPRVMAFVGLALAVVLTAPWIFSVAYLRTERGRAARDEHLARRRDEFLTRWGDENLAKRKRSQAHDRDQSD